jgi:hypothetical protein
VSVAALVGSAIAVVVPVSCSVVVVGVVFSALVDDVGVDVGSVDVVSEVVVDSIEVLVVAPVPTICRFGMTPSGMS